MKINVNNKKVQGRADIVKSILEGKQLGILIYISNEGAGFVQCGDAPDTISVLGSLEYLKLRLVEKKEEEVL